MRLRFGEHFGPCLGQGLEGLEKIELQLLPFLAAVGVEDSCILKYEDHDSNSIVYCLVFHWDKEDILWPCDHQSWHISSICPGDLGEL